MARLFAFQNTYLVPSLYCEIQKKLAEGVSEVTWELLSHEAGFVRRKFYMIIVPFIQISMDPNGKYIATKLWLQAFQRIKLRNYVALHQVQFSMHRDTIYAKVKYRGSCYMRTVFSSDKKGNFHLSNAPTFVWIGLQLREIWYLHYSRNSVQLRLNLQCNWPKKHLLLKTPSRLSHQHLRARESWGKCWGNFRAVELWSGCSMVCQHPVGRAG